MEPVKPEELEAFNKKLKVLLKEFNFNIGGEPYIQDGKILARSVVLPVVEKQLDPTPTPDDKKGK
jgi:hypothetical protein